MEPEELERLLERARERGREPSDPRDRTWSINGWDIDDEGRTLTVHYTGGAADLDPRLTVDETAQAVVLSLRIERAPGGFRNVGYAREITHRLQAPLAGREVLSDGPHRRPLERGRTF